MDRILFLGTGGGRVVNVLQTRATGGIVMQYKQHQIHLDPGPGAIIRAKENGVNVRKTNIVCVSHPHADHFEGLLSIIEGMGNFGREINNFLITHPKSLAPQYALLPKHHETYLKRIITLDENQGVKIGDLRIVALKAEHGDVPSIGFRFITPKYSIIYSGDTEYFGDMKRIYSGSHVIIFNVLRPGGDRLPGHLCTDDISRIINEMETKPKLILITHFGMKMIKSNPIMEARNIFKKTGIPVTAVNDGQKINIAGIMNQQRLFNF